MLVSDALNPTLLLLTAMSITRTTMTPDCPRDALKVVPVSIVNIT